MRARSAEAERSICGNSDDDTEASVARACA
jgi:hypothetical protein